MSETQSPSSSVSGRVINSIRPSRRRAINQSTEAVEKAVAARVTPNASKESSTAPAQKDELSDKRRAAVVPVPPAIAQRFVRVGHKYHFPDGGHAFTDRGHRLTTPSENTEVINSLVGIAQAREWTSVTVRGTERFRKEAWMAATLAGLEVRGYRPTDFEREYLVRTAVSASLQRDSHDTVKNSASRAKPTSTNSNNRDRAEPPVRTRDLYAEKREALLLGALVDHGRAPYRHNDQAEMSYFVKLETERGARTIWGVDLERALRESLTQPRQGDAVGVRATRREPVTVKVKQRDAEGRVLQEQSQTAHRNHWMVEKQAFFTERAQAASMVRDASKDARQGVKAHPELAGTYVYLQGAKELAKKRIRDPQDQKRFVATVRTALADSIARGEPLPPVRLRARTNGKSPAAHEHTARVME